MSAGLITRTIVINITRCVSLAVVFDLISFYFSSLADYISCKKDPTFNQTGSLFKALQFVFYLQLTTFNRHRVKFRFKLCSPYLFCLFLKYIHLNSEWDVKCTNYQILS